VYDKYLRFNVEGSNPVDGQKYLPELSKQYGGDKLLDEKSGAC
jgi:hypothetical protein